LQLLTSNIEAMALAVVLALCTLPALTHQLAFSAQSTWMATELASELAADRTFAGAVGFLDSIQHDIGRLWTALHGSHGSRASLVQLSSRLKAKPAVANSPHKKRMDAATAVKEMAKLKPAQMPAMLGLLTGMYDSWKDKIGDANKKEQEQKKAFEKNMKDLEAKKALHKDSKDAMDTYDRIEKYWKRQRSISHRQYHTALKIMHSGMQKFKAVSGAMSSAIAGKKPSTKDLQAVGMAMPDVVLLQSDLAVWTEDATNDISIARGHLWA